MKRSDKATVLIVDDSESNRLLLSFLLEEFDYTIEEAENGEKAVELALEFPYRMVFMDLNMPVMDGLQATRMLRSLNFEAPIIACTAEDHMDNISTLLSKGFTDYLAKPIEREAIRALLEKLDTDRQTENMDFDNEEHQQRLDQLKIRFITNIPVMLSKLEKALEQRNTTDLKRIGHKIKGSAGQFGFDRATTIGRDIEKAVDKDKWEIAVDKAYSLMAELKKIEHVQGL